MDNAIVDVVIPAYNAANTLESSIGSIQRQTLRDIRIIIVDDGSTDGTAALLGDLAAKDDRILVITRLNGGIVDAVRAGLSHSSAAFVARQDADDISYPDRLERQLAFLQSNPECVAVAGLGRHIDENGSSLGTISKRKIPEEADPAWFPAREPYLLQPMLMLRASALRAVGGYRDLPVAEDSDLFWRLAEIGRLYNMPDVLGDYRLHNTSISSRSIKHGRLIAYYSQLSALSARRRRCGKPDIAFSFNNDPTLADAFSLLNLFNRALEKIDAEESGHFALAISAKLMELAFYRPFELDVLDCLFIAKAYGESKTLLSAENGNLFKEQLIGTAVRLAAKCEWRACKSLLPPALYPLALARLSFRVSIPAPLRSKIKMAGGRL